VIVLAVTTVALFLAGEALILGRTDSGRLLAARYLGIGEPARVTQLVGRQIRLGLEAAGVPADSVQQTVAESGSPAVRWRVGLRPEASLFKVNYAVTQSVSEHGGRVFSGREQIGRDGETRVTLTVGLGRRPMHEVVIVRPPRRPSAAGPPGARLALILFGFGSADEDPAAESDLPRAPLTLALVPGTPESIARFRTAREEQREVILSLPLEPLNYPQVDPGPGTILVTMKSSQIIGLVHRYLEEAAPVAAVSNHLGSLATQDLAVMSALFEELRRAKLPFLHVDPVPGAVCKSLAAKVGVVYDQPDVVVDRETRQSTTAALDRRWNDVLKQARHRGHLMVMLRATPLALKWLPEAIASRRLGDVTLVPASSLLPKPVTL
jgi:polysaccharide deacetylase 2 family uncharacterized protein YibQ